VNETRLVASLKRWLLAIELALRAEDASARGSPADHTMAVVLADTAAESVLALLASLPGVTVTGGRFAQMLRGAFAALDARKIEYAATLAAAVETTHARRNAAVHQGLEATESATAVNTTRELLHLLSLVAPEFPDLPAGAGVLSGVAAMVARATDVASQLRTAEAAFREGRWEQAADAGARALDLVLIQSTPGVWRRPTGLPRPREDEALKSLRQEIARLQAWVEPMALGLSPGDYKRMRAVIGARVMYADGSEKMFRDAEQPTPADLRWALDVLASVIVRLWTSGVMFRGSIKEAVAAGRTST